MLTSFSKPEPGSQPWTMEYVARLFTEGGGFQGIANTHNAALERAKAETEAASDLVLNSHGSRLTKHHICIAQNMGEPPKAHRSAAYLAVKSRNR